jgi:hypothetical protein
MAAVIAMAVLVRPHRRHPAHRVTAIESQPIPMIQDVFGQTLMEVACQEKRGTAHRAITHRHCSRKVVAHGRSGDSVGAKQIHIACRMIDAWRELTVRARDGLHLAHLSLVIRPI